MKLMFFLRTLIYRHPTAGWALLRLLCMALGLGRSPLTLAAAPLSPEAEREAACYPMITIPIPEGIVLEAGAIRYFNCKPLAHNVRTLIKEKRWRFAGKQNPSC